jgi:hypothetical protein
MTAESKTQIKSYFQTSDKPTEGQFANLIDSYQDINSNLTILASAGTGAVGLQLLATSTTAQAQSIIGVVSGGAVGIQLYQAATTAAAVGVLGAGAVGLQVFQSTTTAAAFAALGAGAVGTQIFQAATTTQAQSAIGIQSGTYQPVFTMSLNTTTVSAAPWLFFVNSSAVSVAGNLVITPTSAGGALSEFFVSLPVASTFAAKSNCSGVLTAEVTAQTGGVACVATDTRARVNFAARSVNAQDSFVTFQYRILP